MNQLVQENHDANQSFEACLDRLISDHARLDRENAALKNRLARRDARIRQLEARLETVRKAVGA